MGNCCNPKEKPKHPKSNTSPSPSPKYIPTSEKTPKQARKIFIRLEGSPDLAVKYRSNASIQELWEEISDTHTHLNRDSYGLYDGLLEITDFTATLRDLNITPRKNAHDSVQTARRNRRVNSRRGDHQ